MRGGLDLTYGTDGFAFYVTMGSAWPTFQQHAWLEERWHAS
jgi:hypothetical protein